MNETLQPKALKRGNERADRARTSRSLRLARGLLLDCLCAIGEKARATGPSAPAKGRGKQSAAAPKKRPFKLTGRPELTELLNREVIDLVLHPECYKPFGNEAPASILLHGEPGCGKTYAVDRLVEYLGWTCVRITGAVYSSNAHEDHIREHFEEAFKAKARLGHAVVVMDEMDSFLYNRDQDRGRNPWVVQEANTFLQCLQEAHNKGVLVIGMTNALDSLDPAAIRPERFDLRIRVAMPTREEVEALIRHRMKSMPKERGLKLDAILDELAGKSMADAALMLRLIGLQTGGARKRFVDQDSLDAALKRYRATRGQERAKADFGFKCAC